MPARIAAPGVLAAALVIALAGGSAPEARAQFAQSIDPSARSGGMGGAAVAVDGGGTHDLWLNPALAATQPGVFVQSGTQQLVPGLALDLQHHATRIGASFAGLALTSSGRPFGGTTLVQPYVVAQPDTVGNWNGLGWDELVEARGAAISLAGVGDALWALAGRSGAPFSRRGDVAWGRQWKRVTSNAMFRQTSFSAHDEGWFVRAVALDTRHGAGAGDGGARVELSWGSSTQDLDPSPSWGIGNGVALVDRAGGAVRFTWWGPQRSGEPGGAWADVFRGGFSPLLDVVLAYDHQRTDPRIISRRPDPVLVGTWTVEHYGIEATFSRIATARFGYVDDPSGGITKPAWGLGACLPLRHAGEVRYDFASWPQAYDRRVYRHEVSLRLDPFARRGARRAGGGTTGE
jgi:hypothetical protein